MTLVEGFAWVLADYEMPEILAAFRQYIITKSDIPAPADIIAIIKENRVPVPIFTVDQIKRFAAKGIPLTLDQRRILDESQAHQVNMNTLSNYTS